MACILPVFPPVSVGIRETLGLFGGLPQVLIYARKEVKI